MPYCLVVENILQGNKIMIMVGGSSYVCLNFFIHSANFTEDSDVSVRRTKLQISAAALTLKLQRLFA